MIIVNSYTGLVTYAIIITLFLIFAVYKNIKLRKGLAHADSFYEQAYNDVCYFADILQKLQLCNADASMLMKKGFSVKREGVTYKMHENEYYKWTKQSDGRRWIKCGEINHISNDNVSFKLVDEPTLTSKEDM